MKIKVNYKKILFILVVYVIYINLFKGYISYYPTIPVYPNNNTDLEIMKKEMAKRTPEDVKLFFDTNTSIAAAFTPYVKETENELTRIALSQNYIINFFKYSINRRRPYQIDKTFKPLSTLTSGTPAYPAGHAYQAMVVAKYLSNKYPEKKALFNNIALKCDECRVKAGIHYKSDGEFSRQLFYLFN